MEYKIERLSYLDEKRIDIICQMLNTDYDQAISKYLIFHDKNYKDYLTTSLKGLHDIVYTVISLADNKLLQSLSCRYYCGRKAI